MKERIYRIPAGIPHTIAQLSDIHGQDGNEILKILIRRRPSLIAVSGDLFLDHAQEGDSLIDLQPKVIPLIRACAALAPTYISLGNHEWLASPADIRALQSTGAVLLDNRWVRDQGTGLLIGGLTSAMVMDFRRFRKKHTPEHQYPKKKRHVDGLVLHPSVRWLRTFEEQDGYKILLCHHPEYWCLQTRPLLTRPGPPAPLYRRCLQRPARKAGYFQGTCKYCSPSDPPPLQSEGSCHHRPALKSAQAFGNTGRNPYAEMKKNLFISFQFR